ncbi:Uncharacterised protein [Mycobacterium tuberculosis]|nr:Uncharacterised protein [Mycobacterium tuberculosis]
MDGVGPGLGCRVEDLGEVQIGLRRGLAAQRERLVGQPNMRGLGVGFGVHRHAGQAGVAGRPDHPHCDLAAIGDENLRDPSDPRAGVTSHCASCRADSSSLRDFLTSLVGGSLSVAPLTRSRGSSIQSASRSRRLIRASIADIPRNRSGLIKAARPSSV